MKESVVIKGTKSGIILVLDDKLPYEQLKEAVADKLTGTIVKEIYVPKKIINIVMK